MRMLATMQHSFGLAIHDFKYARIRKPGGGNRTLLKNVGEVYLHILERLALALMYRHRPCKNQWNLDPVIKSLSSHGGAQLT